MALAFAGLAGLLLTAACAPEVQAGWTPPSWPETEVRVRDAHPAPAAPASLPALTAQRLRSDAAGVHARMSYLPGRDAGVAPFNARIDELVRAAIDGQTGDYRPTAAPGGAGLAERGCVTGSTLRAASDLLADPEFGPPDGTGVAVVCDIVVARGDLFGQRVRIVAGSAGAVTADATVVIYTDVATGEIFTGEEVWNPDAAGALVDDVVAVLRREAGSLAPRRSVPVDEDPAVLRRALATAVPAGDGALAFTLGTGFPTPDLLDLGMTQTETPIVIEVPAELVTTLATPFGQRLAAASDTPFVRDEIVPASREWIDCTLLPCVALTYDDGPSSRTPRLLDVLAEERATASFFVLGPYAASNRHIVARAHAEGHEVAGHTWSHPDMTTLTDEQIQDEIDRTNSLLQSITGARVTSFRPPYGAVDARVRAAAGLPAILWSVDTRDWSGPSDAELLASAVDDAFPGAIVLFHDTHERSVRLAPEVIAGLRDRGLTPVTVTQLFGGTLPAAGHLRRAP